MINKKNEKPTLIPPHGGYCNLKSYQTAEIIYDAPPPSPPCQGGERGEVDSFIDKRSRTHDQQLRQLEKQFMEEGGFTEKLYQARQQVRGK